MKREDIREASKLLNTIEALERNIQELLKTKSRYTPNIETRINTISSQGSGCVNLVIYNPSPEILTLIIDMQTKNLTTYNKDLEKL